MGQSVHAKAAEWASTRPWGTLSPRSRRLPRGASVHAIVCFRCCGSVSHRGEEPQAGGNHACFWWEVLRVF